jgi:hypothetical protein
MATLDEVGKESRAVLAQVERFGLLACQSAGLDLDHAALLDDATSATVADPRDASRGSPRTTG